MGATATFLTTLLGEGRMLVEAPGARDPLAVPVLEEAYHLRALELAGPAIPFDRDTALAAGDFVHRAAWHLLTQNQELAPLRMPHLPTTPSHHASADIVFRFLPTLHRRALALRPSDPLTEILSRTLREWPLSGVLARGIEPPITPPDFGHAGLALLYAERLARHESLAWLPGGDGFDAVEVVWRQLGRDAPVLRPPVFPTKDDA